MISPSPAVTLFTHQVDSSRPRFALLASVVIHSLVITVVSLGILLAPVTATVQENRYLVRRLDLNTPDHPPASAPGGSASPAAEEVARALARSSEGAMPSIAVHAQHGPQTLLQPDLPVRLTQAVKIPVPRVMLWSPRTAIVKVVEAPRPQPPATAPRPALDLPNHELSLADVNIASSNLPTQKLQVLPSRTSPLAAPSPSPAEAPPATVADSAHTPTPAAILSASDLQLKNGPAMLPPLNEAQKSDAVSAALGAGESGNLRGQRGTAGSGKQPAPSSSATRQVAAAGPAPGTAPGAPQASASAVADGDRGAATEITLPKNGQFGAVVVGASLEDQFPETADAWNGRMAYTVYLHVGLARSWILQYALPSAADAEQAGSIAHLQAPWPYSIVRPNLPPDAINADALLVHGFVNLAGRFDSLSIAFPQDLPNAQFILKSLQQWQFRPASQNGQPVRVEVLLIVPEELE